MSTFEEAVRRHNSQTVRSKTVDELLGEEKKRNIFSELTDSSYGRKKPWWMKHGEMTGHNAVAGSYGHDFCRDCDALPPGNKGAAKPETQKWFLYDADEVLEAWGR